MNWINWDFVLIGYLVGGFLGLKTNFKLFANEIINPVYRGIKRLSIIISSAFMLLIWFGGIIYLVAKYFK